MTYETRPLVKIGTRAMTMPEERPLVKLLADRVQVLFENPVTMSPAEIREHYQEVLDAFEQLSDDDKEHFVCFLLGYSWGTRARVKQLSSKSNTELPQMWA